MVRMKMSDVESTLTEEEIKELEKTETIPITYDDDSPQMTAEMLKQFHDFDAVPIRVSPETIHKAKAYDKDYLGLLSRLIEVAFDDKDLIRKCI